MSNVPLYVTPPTTAASTTVLTFAGVIAVRSFVPVVASALVAILIFPETVSLASGTEAAPADGGKNKTDMMELLR